MDQETVQNALKVFDVKEILTVELLQKRYRELRLTWHPHRYANLTNNPRKYMEMYKKGEAKTKEVEAAYKVLMDWLEEQPNPSPGPERKA